MKPLQELIERIRRMPEVEVVDRPQSFVLRMAVPTGLLAEIEIPHNVLEWFATVHDGSTEVWSDWIGYGGPEVTDDRDVLLESMLLDVEIFVMTLARADDFRVSSQLVLLGLHRQTAEWRIDGEWRDVSMVPAAQR